MTVMVCCSVIKIMPRRLHLNHSENKTDNKNNVQERLLKTVAEVFFMFMRRHVILFDQPVMLLFIEHQSKKQYQTWYTVVFRASTFKLDFVRLMQPGKYEKPFHRYP